MDPRNKNIELNGRYHGFKVLRIEETSYEDVIFYDLIHEVTGARMIHLSMDDSNNAFMVTFRTLPENSTGVAHILEHAVLEGSKQFPVKIFKHLPGRSLNTFLNAMTSADYTAYPYGAQNRKDFYNLMRLYMDASFFPLLKEETFLQEGWRYEFADPEDPKTPLEFKGVVYNEMKGAMGNPVRLFFEAGKQAMFPDLIYSNASGGSPPVMPDLTYEEWKAFHAYYYHPSNAYLATAGNFPLMDNLELIQNFTLKQFQHLDPPGLIPHQKSFPKPMVFRKGYPAQKAEETQRKSIIAMSWKLIPIEDFYENLKFSLLTLILTGDNTSILTRNLLSSGLGNGPSPGDFDSSYNESTYSVGLMDADEGDAEKIETIILDTLKQVASDGFPDDEVDAALHQMEFHAREIRGDHSIPFGLNLIFRGTSDWINGGDFLDGLQINSAIDQLRKDVKTPGFFQDMARKYLLENPHRATIILYPEPGGIEMEELAERTRLDNALNAMAPEDITRVIEQSEKLRRYQNNPGDTSCLPQVDIGDISRDPDTIPQHHFTIDEIPVYLHSLETNDVDYLILGFQSPLTDGLPDQATALLDLIPELGAGDRNYVELSTQIHTWTGGIGLKTFPYRNLNSDTAIFSLSMSGRCLHRNFSKMKSLMKDILFEPDFADHRHIMELIASRKAYAVPMAGYHGHRMAMLAAGRKLSKIQAIHHRDSGLEFIRYLNAVNEDSIGELTDTFTALLQGMLNRSALHIGVTGNIPDPSMLAGELNPVLDRLPESPDQPIPVETDTGNSQDPEAWVINTGVSYVARVFNAVHETHPDSPVLTVLSDLMEEPLYSRIRARGGAYGAFASYNSEAAVFNLMTYRDPHTAMSLDAFREVIHELGAGGFNEEQLQHAIIETIRKYDIPPSPREKGMIEMSRVLRGRTYEMRKKHREAILDTTREDIQRVIETYLSDDVVSSVAILTSDKILQNSETAPLNLKRIPLVD